MTAKVRDIGIDVDPPAGECSDENCPFHGSLPVRGQAIEGTVVSLKMDRTAVVERNYLKFQKKYERYEKRSSKYSAHAPACLDLKAGDSVTMMECRPLSKTVSFVIVEKKVRS